MVDGRQSKPFLSNPEPDRDRTPVTLHSRKKGNKTKRPTSVDSSLVEDVEQLSRLLREGTAILDIRAWRIACSAGLQERVSRALLRGRGPQLELGVGPRPGGAPGGW